MRAHEFLSEGFPPAKTLDAVQTGIDVAGHALPTTYVIPDLANQDFYKMYRFGLAIAATRGEDGEKFMPIHQKECPDFEPASDWGELQFVSSSEEQFDKLIDRALSKVGLKTKTSVSTLGSTEIPDTNQVSPMNAFKGYKK